MHRKLFATVVLLALALSVASCVPVSASELNYDADSMTISAEEEVPVIISKDMYGVCRIENMYDGKDSWSDHVFVLTLSDAHLMNIHIYDRWGYGDYYELWDVTGVSKLIGTTPPVPTDGSMGYSEATFTIFLEPGVYKFRVRDPAFAIFPYLSPAGFYIGFHYPPTAVGGKIVPVNSLVLLAPWIAVAIAALTIGFTLSKRKLFLH